MAFAVERSRACGRHILLTTPRQRKMASEARPETAFNKKTKTGSATARSESRGAACPRHEEKLEL